MSKTFDDQMIDHVFLPCTACLPAQLQPVEAALFVRLLAGGAICFSLVYAPPMVMVMVLTIVAFLRIFHSLGRFTRWCNRPDLMPNLRVTDRARRSVGGGVTLTLFALYLTAWSWDGLGHFIAASILCNISNWLAACQNRPWPQEAGFVAADEPFAMPA